ncbi:MAG: 2-amino-4-hydroxy-6-hydroxymethyldihydropteridine diphosphokinase [Bacteroidia bacterium]|nr:2-amino-4-hydroxy-6-hydroxymethyldihydropteridine diphosphokinase [Bacteroidia bacterium]
MNEREVTNKVYIALGGNLGNKVSVFCMAEELLSKEIGDIIAKSSNYESEAVGFSSKNTFLNNVICLVTPLSPLQVLSVTQDIEKRLGRTEKSLQRNYKDRIIDIDILYYNDIVINTYELTIPHPNLQEREFVLKPLLEIAPDKIHPAFLLNTKEMWVRYQNQHLKV